jgi:hypothetical protein
MNYDDAEQHLKSAYLACAKTLNEFRNGGLTESAADSLIDFEFYAWSMLDKMRE